MIDAVDVLARFGSVADNLQSQPRDDLGILDDVTLRPVELVGVVVDLADVIFNSVYPTIEMILDACFYQT